LNRQGAKGAKKMRRPFGRERHRGLAACQIQSDSLGLDPSGLLQGFSVFVMAAKPPYMNRFFTIGGNRDQRHFFYKSVVLKGDVSFL
jgi:hypothetical protein